MNYITLREAARIYGVTYYALWRAAGRKSLKCTKINGMLHTTREWLRQYKKHLRDKEVVSRYNGMKTFDCTREEYSTKRVAKMLGIKRAKVYRLIYLGLLKSVRKGAYHIITRSSMEAYLNKVEVFVHEFVS